MHFCHTLKKVFSTVTQKLGIGFRMYYRCQLTQERISSQVPLVSPPPPSPYPTSHPSLLPTHPHWTPPSSRSQRRPCFSDEVAWRMSHWLSVVAAPAHAAEITSHSQYIHITTSDKGPSEIGTTSLQRTLVRHHANTLVYYFTSEIGTTSIQWIKLFPPKCPLFRGSTVFPKSTKPLVQHMLQTEYHTV